MTQTKQPLENTVRFSVTNPHSYEVCRCFEDSQYPNTNNDHIVMDTDIWIEFEIMQIVRCRLVAFAPSNDVCTI